VRASLPLATRPTRTYTTARRDRLFLLEGTQHVSHPPQGSRTRQLVIDQLESLQRAGVLQIPRGRGVASPPERKNRKDEKDLKDMEVPSLFKASGCRLALPEQLEGLKVLQSSVVACTKCPVLVQNRSQTVFGVGNPEARVCFLGEAPGADEDRQGEPFVGRAGQLLTRMIEACTLKREDVYILNILKCRPPDNRTPTPDEITNCRPFFERQLELLRPEFICCLGAVAAQGLLQTNTPVGKLRGRLHDYQWAKVIVTYHPAYLLRSPDQKRAAWEDLKLLMREMGLDVPEKFA